MTASGQITVAELGHVMRRHVFRQQRIPIVIYGLIAFSLLLREGYRAIVAPELLAKSRILWMLMWVPPALFIFVICFLVFGCWLFARQQISSSPNLSGEMTFAFGDKDFEIQTPLTYSRSKWGALHTAWESKEAFILQPSKIMMQVIPKRMLNSPDDIHTLRELLRSQLGKKARLFKPQTPA